MACAPNILFPNVTWRMKAGIVKRVEAVIARQRHGKHVSAARDTDATIEDVVYSARPLLGNCTVNPFQQKLINMQQYINCLRSNSRGCNVGTTDRRNLWSTPLRWARVAWYNIRSFINIGSGIQKLLGGIHIQTHKEYVDLRSLFYFSKIRKVG
jgi:hypothetical protein